uniref:outer membrane beta-barrel domain-containing protein n=1 Tax=Desulfuromonas sp. TF TaxID=1232410 RepID=UPI000482082A
MKISKHLSAALIMAIGLLPALSWAENRVGALTLSPMYGAIVMEGDQNIDDDWGYGLGIGYNFTKAFGLEAVVNYVEMEEEVTNDDLDFWNYRIDALYHFNPDNALVPYVALGAGVYDLDSDQEFMANYGVGLLYYVAEDVALRADVRHLAAFNESNLENNLLYTAGLKFQLGGREEAPAPVAAAAVAAPVDSDGDGVT